MRLRLFPEKPTFKFMRWQMLCMVMSVVGIVLSAVLAFYPGLNYGIDFEGGILVEVKTPGPADLGTLRAELNGLGLGQVALQEFGAADDVLIRIQRQEGGEDAQQQAVETVKNALNELSGEDVTFRRTEFVGPKVSEELLQDGMLAIGLSLVAVLIYIWFRFEWQYGVGAIAALIHDIALTIGMFAVTGLEVNLTTVAAVLTIVGYSLNDTVVIFDRIRENLRRFKSMPISELIDLSINETLARTCMTSLTTLIALLALFFFGGEVVKGFTFAMIWGVLVGTYSTVYIAAPILIHLDLRSIGRNKAEAEQAP
ncbi:MAG: protein translocase subunit SecF [Geminicoccaceae bacterium]|nr:protein translocase subunit SecF [Geminicoccaceae bacterium]